MKIIEGMIIENISLSLAKRDASKKTIWVSYVNFFFYLMIYSFINTAMCLDMASFLLFSFFGCAGSTLGCMDLLLAAGRLSCPLACGLSVPQPGIQPHHLHWKANS